MRNSRRPGRAAETLLGSAVPSGWCLVSILAATNWYWGLVTHLPAFAHPATHTWPGRSWSPLSLPCTSLEEEMHLLEQDQDQARESLSHPLSHPASHPIPPCVPPVLPMSLPLPCWLHPSHAQGHNEEGSRIMPPQPAWRLGTT